MLPNKTVFISHRDAAVAREVDHLIERAFEGRVRTFNTSRQDRGLSSGDRIDPRLLEALGQCDVFLSLWTPSAVEHPAWMAWELGAAAAQARAGVLTARALGTPLDRLPLNLQATFTPDLADTDEVLSLLHTIAERLGEGFQPSVARETHERHEPFEPSPLRARRVEDRVVVTIHGTRRGLLENRTDVTLEDVDVWAPTPAPNSAQVVVDAMQRALAHRRTGARPQCLDGRGRVVFNLPEHARVEADREILLEFEWLATGAGRERQRVIVELPEGIAQRETLP